MSKKVILADKAVGCGESVYIAAEGGLTNWGDVELAKKQVDAAMAAGCDAIKFQAQTTEHLVSKKEDPRWHRRLKYKELSHSELCELRDYVAARNIEFFATAHVDADLDFLDKVLDVPFLKVGSGESVNYEFLKNVGSRGKPVIMSLGLHMTDEEILKSLTTLENAGTKDIVVLHCSTVYPTPPEINDLSRITHLKSLTDYPVGYSDHTVGWHMVIAAVALGAVFIEKHISFDKYDKRSLDCPGSGTPEDWKYIVEEIRDVEKALRMTDTARARRDEAIKNARTWARQSITARRTIPQGSMITEDMLVLKRPGTGMGPEALRHVIGKKAARTIEEDCFVRPEDFA